ncbi:lysylphosphatidylglycerol synthase transmembrane domain-containing protein [Flammeovirga sp. EKP202]|uniref:lysylphosphatidylglycerol synthase transmembrane domain-containing protein n=1 Tax=Flammeovirga sp. EKP202 TaxID=2770592 RepID=UPI00165FB2B4|nr:lysylphosphatidylglycerol synthase transmembrane domain-containing protein [Flammeovirga sp. EKP202]MBD0400947.1 flippase-like domain-containing protein [Flammeovirga sp. EKP202]
MKLQEILKYIFSFVLAGLLLWYVLKEQNIQEVASSFEDLNWGIVFSSILISLTSHYIRGLRWGLMLKPLNYKASGPNLFMATMTGYAGNVIIPRFGEFFRCGILQKLTKIPAKTSFGAVVAERAIDLVIFIILFSIAFFSQFEKLESMILPHVTQNEAELKDKIYILIIIGIVGSAILGVLFKIRKRLFKTPLFRKFYSFIHGILEGMAGVFKLRSKDLATYLLYTVLIWITYFYMCYVLFFAIEGTSHLSTMVGFVMMMMGGLGMVLPTPGGTGSYHFFATQTLLIYGVTETNAIAFALLMHTSQTVSVLTIGGISTLIANLKKTPENIEQTEKNGIKT